MGKDKAMDPRVMFLFVFLLSMASVALRGALALVPAAVSAVAAAAWARAPFAQVLRRLGGLWVTLVLIALLQAWFSGNLLQGLLAGAAVLERLMILMLGGALLAKYPGHVLAQGMLQLRMPYQLAYMVSIGLRFLPLFRESYQDSLMAIQLRGVDFRELKWRGRMKVYTYLLMPTIVAGINNARRLAMAMDLRGFGACEQRGSYAPLRMGRRDWAAFAGVLAWAAGIAAAEMFLRGL